MAVMVIMITLTMIIIMGIITGTPIVFNGKTEKELLSFGERDPFCDIVKCVGDFFVIF